jgi:hypothetical protein
MRTPSRLTSAAGLALVLAWTMAVLASPMPPTLSASAPTIEDTTSRRLPQQTLIAAHSDTPISQRFLLPDLLLSIRKVFDDANLRTPAPSAHLKVAPDHAGAASSTDAAPKDSGASKRPAAFLRKTTEYFSQPLQGTETRDAPVLKRVQLEKASVKTRSWRTGVASREVEAKTQYVNINDASLESSRFASPHPGIGDGPVNADVQGVIAGNGGKLKDADAPPIQEKSFWEGLRSSINNVIHGRKNGEVEKELAATDRAQVSARDVNTLVDEIIKQIQLRTKEEFSEHRDFLEREQNVAVRPSVTTFDTAVSIFMTVLEKLFSSSGMSQNDVRRVRAKTTQRLVALMETKRAQRGQPHT